MKKIVGHQKGLWKPRLHFRASRKDPLNYPTCANIRQVDFEGQWPQFEFGRPLILAPNSWFSLKSKKSESPMPFELVYPIPNPLIPAKMFGLLRAEYIRILTYCKENQPNKEMVELIEQTHELILTIKLNFFETFREIDKAAEPLVLQYRTLAQELDLTWNIEHNLRLWVEKTYIRFLLLKLNWSLILPKPPKSIPAKDHVEFLKFGRNVLVMSRIYSNWVLDTLCQYRFFHGEPVTEVTPEQKIAFEKNMAVIDEFFNRLEYTDPKL